VAVASVRGSFMASLSAGFPPNWTAGKLDSQTLAHAPVLHHRAVRLQRFGWKRHRVTPISNCHSPPGPADRSGAMRITSICGRLLGLALLALSAAASARAEGPPASGDLVKADLAAETSSAAAG